MGELLTGESQLEGLFKSKIVAKFLEVGMALKIGLTNLYQTVDYDSIQSIEVKRTHFQWTNNSKRKRLTYWEESESK